MSMSTPETVREQRVAEKEDAPRTVFGRLARAVLAGLALDGDGLCGADGLAKLTRYIQFKTA